MTDTCSLQTSLKKDVDCHDAQDLVVNPMEVKAEKGKSIDYSTIVSRFHTSPVTPDLVARIERLTGRRAHRLLRRGIFFSHRDLERILDLYEAKKPFYLYTGRGPSSRSLHVGHLLQFQFTRYLQKAFDVPLVIQLTDDEKFFWNPSISLEESHRLAYENAKDIIACGFGSSTTLSVDEAKAQGSSKGNKTFIFTDLDYMGTLYPNVCKIQKAFTFNQVRSTFGFDASSTTVVSASHSSSSSSSTSLHIGKLAFPAIQAAPSFCNSFPHLFGQRTDIPCLIPCGIDQDPYFRLTRDVASPLGYQKPALIHSKFLPSLKGVNEKMSASDPTSNITCADSPREIDKKINGSFSGGGKTLEEHKAKGANLDVDVAYHYLTFFLEDDDHLYQIGSDYKAGKMLGSQVKTILADELKKVIAQFQEQRALVTDEVVKSFTTTAP